jgi:hypothetical protein
MRIILRATEPNLVTVCKNEIPGRVTAERRQCPAGNNALQSGRTGYLWEYLVSLCVVSAISVHTAQMRGLI